MDINATRNVPGSSDLTAAAPGTREANESPEAVEPGAAGSGQVDRIRTRGLRGLLYGRLSLARLAWLAIAFLSVILFIASLPARYYQFSNPSADVRAGLAQLGASVGFYATYRIGHEVFLALCYFVVAVLIFSRKADDSMAIFSSLTLVTFGLGLSGPVYVLADIHGMLRGPLLFLVLLGWAFLLLFFYLFPDAQFVPRWTRLLAVAWVTWLLAWGLFPGAPFSPLAWSPTLSYAVVAGWVATGVLAQAYRYRGIASPVQRQQTKWVVFGFAVALAGIFAINLPRAIYPSLNRPGQSELLYELISWAVMQWMLLLIPISIAVSVLRYRLWHIDLVINRALVYIPLTAIIAGVYTASIGFFQRLFTALTSEKSDAAIVVATLFVASIFTPVKNGLQALVDKRFKQAPDPATELRSLDERMRSFAEMKHPEQLASRVLEQAIAAFHAQGGAVYLAQPKDGQPQLVHASEGWNESNAKISMPLESNGERLGLLSLGARHHGADYTWQDQERLRQTVGLLAEIVGLAARAN